MNAKLLFFVFLPILLIFSASPPPAHSESLNVSGLLKNGSVRVETTSGESLLSYREDELFVPASILKIATGFCALEELGPDFTFSTSFFTDNRGTLYVKGSGDPGLVSEELASISKELSSRTATVNRIVIDPSLFSPDIDLDGVANSLNPYDSRNAAFVGNFSTAYVTRRKNGVIESAEPQTPLTPLSRKAALNLRRGATERINLGKDWKTGTLYGGELLAEFLRRAGVRGRMQVEIGHIPNDAHPVITYRSSQLLSDMIRGMLKFSTNFTANQLFLTLGIKKYGAPATVTKGQRALRECLEQRAGWRNFSIEEGSGLSRKNAVSAQLMTKLLKHFSRYQELLDEQQGFQAKTGSLNGVNSLAGYFDTPHAGQVRFAIIINSQVPHLYKFSVANKIRDHLNAQRINR
jgi:D-alanyl-D-alanine carboxypeptidase/D-alanyl-D-alanine-endopeptidase (penicillin-binding protein 4)